MKGRWRGATPERPFPSLGWGVLDHSYAYLPSPSDETKPLIYTPEQARRIVKWFEIHPLTGQFVRTTMILEEAKGWGKSPFAASLDIEDFVGPVCFDGWDANGEPVGVPWGTGDRLAPWIQIAAVSEDQTDNTYGALYAMLAARKGKVADNLGIDVGRTRLYLPHNPAALLEPVTASAGSRTGQRITKITADETWLWNQRNGGRKLRSTLYFNLSKTNGRAVETTNSPILGERSIAEQSDPDHPTNNVLHFARRARKQPDLSWTDEQITDELQYVYDDGSGNKVVPWITIPRLVSDIRDPRTLWTDSLRLFFNIRSAATGIAVDPRRWDAIAKPRELPRGTEIGIGFDGSINLDESWLRGCTRDGYRFTIERWARPENAPIDWRVPRKDVRAKLEWAFDFYRVGRLVCDPFKWWTEIEDWADAFGLDSEGKPRVEILDTNQETRFAPAVDRWLTSIAEADPETGVGTHDGHTAAADHVKAAHLRRVRQTEIETDGRTKYVLVKGDDHKRIDGAVADVLALDAAMGMAEAPAPFRSNYEDERLTFATR